MDENMLQLMDPLEQPRRVKTMVPGHAWALVQPYGLRPEAADLKAVAGAAGRGPGRSGDDVKSTT